MESLSLLQIGHKIETIDITFNIHIPILVKLEELLKVATMKAFGRNFSLGHPEQASEFGMCAQRLVRSFK